MLKLYQKNYSVIKRDMYEYYTVCIFFGVIHQSAGLTPTPYLNLQVPATQTMNEDQNYDVSYLRQASGLGNPIRKVVTFKEENNPFQCKKVFRNSY